MAPFESNCIDVRLAIAVLTNDFHDMAMYGDYFRLGRDDVANGPMSLACYVEQLEDV